MVIDAHCNCRIGILKNIFPYDSFFMPLFVFISGYFYKKSKVVDNIKHKFKKLLIPYLIWNIFFIIFTLLLNKIFNINWYVNLSLSSFILSLFYAPVTNINNMSWFVVMLFWVSIIYNIIYSNIGETKFIDILLTIVFLVLGFLSVYLCVNGYNLKDIDYLFWLRTLFYIQFYHYGYIFKKYLENKLLKFNKIIICSCCILINVILLNIFGDNVNFYETISMNNFSYWYLPLITSMTAIIFYYEIAEFIMSKVGYIKIIDFIARNTFTIMEVHMVFANIPNLYIYTKMMNGSKDFLDFDLLNFKYNSWYRYDSVIVNILSFFIGLFGSLLVAYVISKILNTYKKEKNTLGC